MLQLEAEPSGGDIPDLRGGDPTRFLEECAGL
jgi:hypothetical protein